MHKQIQFPTCFYAETSTSSGEKSHILEQKEGDNIDCSIPATIHGFSGYFDCVLYKDITFSTVPETFSTGMFSWFPMFIPIENPLHIRYIPITDATETTDDLLPTTNSSSKRVVTKPPVIKSGMQYATAATATASTATATKRTKGSIATVIKSLPQQQQHELAQQQQQQQQELAQQQQQQHHHEQDVLAVNVSRVVSRDKMWYEWTLVQTNTGKHITKTHNYNGECSSVSL